MNKLSRIVGTLSFAAIGLVALFIGARPARVATQPQQQNEAQKARHPNLKIQNLRGDAARLRAKQLRKLNKGVARAMRDLEKKGLREAFDQGIVVSATDPSKTAGALLGSHADTIRKVSFGTSPQDTFYDGDYEVSFFPYDDGDPNTWEGIIYRNGPDIDEDTRYAVIDISTEDFTVSQEMYYPPDGGDPCSTREGSQCYYQLVKHSNKANGNRQPSAQTSSACGEARWASLLKPAMWTSPLPQGCPAGQHRCIGHEAVGCCGPIPPIDNWIKCSIWGSGGAAISCSRSGPAWGECWALRTAAVMFVCLGR